MTSTHPNLGWTLVISFPPSNPLPPLTGVLFLVGLSMTLGCIIGMINACSRSNSVPRFISKYILPMGTIISWILFYTSDIDTTKFLVGYTVFMSIIIGYYGGIGISRIEPRYCLRKKSHSDSKIVSV